MARAGRDYEGLGEALGLFVKYLPLETEMEEGERFTELVRQTIEAVRELEKWQEYFSWGRRVRQASVARTWPTSSTPQALRACQKG